MSRFDWAPAAYRMLNGVFCVYKPEGVQTSRVVSTVKRNLTRDLNALPCYQHEIPLCQTSIQENTDVTSVSLMIESNSIQDWSEHRLVLGDRYEETDFKVNVVDSLSRQSSGVLVLGIGQYGYASLSMIAMSKFLRVYHVKGRLGWATDDFTPTGRILERTSFKHVKRLNLDRICSAAQAAHTRQMYSLHGVNPDSQEAYEMAAQGIIRPSERKSEAILYGIKCIDFQPPNFTLEIHSINETCNFLRKLIHDLGIQVKSTAVCSGIRRLRYGYFNPQRGILRQHWHLQPIIDNIEMNMDLLTPDRLFVGTQVEKRTLPPPSCPSGYLTENQHLIGKNINEVHDNTVLMEPKSEYSARQAKFDDQFPEEEKRDTSENGVR